MERLLASSINIFCTLLIVMLLVRVLLPLMKYNPRDKWVILLFQLTDPILEPIKRLLGKYNVSMTGIDFAPLIAMLLIQFAQKILVYFIYIVF